MQLLYFGFQRAWKLKQKVVVLSMCLTGAAGKKSSLC